MNTEKKQYLFIFSGLPGSGKTILAKALAERTKSVYLRIDNIEQGLRELCKINVQGEGYRLTYRIVDDNLKIGNNVITDSCNPWNLTRREWENIAIKNNSDFINIYVKCSDKKEHKKRIELRANDIKGLQLPDWEQIQRQEFHEWKEDHIEIDTAKNSTNDCIEELFERLKERGIEL